MSDSLRLPLGPEIARGPELEVLIEGRPVTAHLGETVATVLLAEGQLAMRTTVDGSPRGVFCGMGVCFDCLVVVDGVPGTRACVTWVRDGMTVSRQDGPGYPRNRPPEASGAAPG
jgi:predicted molibdopterin-dependent oxidoreductase YjgC